MLFDKKDGEVHMREFPGLRLRSAGLAAACAVLLGLAANPAAQMASRPADEWTKTLDSPERLASLRVREVIASLELKPGDVVADLGAGTGPFAVPFAEAVGPKGMVYAVEIDRGFFPYVEQRARAAGVGNLHVVLGAFTDPNLPTSDVDVAFFHDVMHHIENRAAYLKNLTKYLKPTARIVVIDYQPAQSPHGGEPQLQVSREQAHAWLADIGFRPLEEVSLFSEKWFVIYGR